MVLKLIKTLSKQWQLDTLNPRPEYLIGVGVFHTPEQFGGGPVNAKPILEKSLAKFEKFKSENDHYASLGQGSS